jgi:hypothetical protein
MDSQRRKYFITINNPLDHGFTRNRIKDVLKSHAGIKFWAMADEIAPETGTPHTHIALYSESPIRHSSLRRSFDGKADIEPVKTTIRDCINYLKKGETASDADAE